MSPPDVTIREARGEDHGAISAVLTAAFKQRGEKDLVKKLWDDNAMAIENVAEANGRIVGYCAFSAVTCKPGLDGVLLGLAPVAIAPGHQGKGVGAALIQEGLKLAREKDARMIVVLGDPNYYARFGFVPASEKNMRWAVMDAGDAFRVITSDNSHWGDIDADETRTIHYHPAFDDLS